MLYKAQTHSTCRDGAAFSVKCVMCNVITSLQKTLFKPFDSYVFVLQSLYEHFEASEF